MVPTSLVGWTLDAVSSLIQSGALESEVFDFKERLPHSDDAGGKERLRSVCAAFANAEGGFLVFGVADKGNPSDRVVGVDNDAGFAERFGQFPKSCSPSVTWQFRNPPIALPDDRVLHVIQIAKSNNGPHAVGSAESGWRFPKRTNQGTGLMTMQEVRTAFLGLYEKRLKLQLLRAELLAIQQTAAAAAVTDPMRIDKDVSLTSFDLQVLETVLADTYSITADQVQLHQRMSQIRWNARTCNVRLDLIRGVVYSALTGKGELIRNHNEAIRPLTDLISQQCREAAADLDRFLGA
jgi:predicted HTH transcriptional regulator